MAKISKHPSYIKRMREWRKLRLTYEGGTEFVNAYLKRFSSRENYNDFRARKEMTYVPCIARAAIIEIRNALSQRLNEVVRFGPKAYLDAMENNVDTYGHSMTQFLGGTVLEELLALEKVGIWVDSNPLVGQARPQPYMYFYRTEDILNWDDELHPTKILLEEAVDTYDELGLVSEPKKVYRYAQVVEGKVEVRFLDDEMKDVEAPQTLDLPRLPFVVVTLKSLIKDIANHQIALTNLASSDMNFCVRANIPFYTEQYDIQSDMMQKQLDGQTYIDTAQNSGENPTTPVGVSVGRRYPKGLDRPEWIAPPTEPLEASMAKQDAIKKEARQLVNLALTNLSPTRSSSDSKEADQAGMEAGLAHISMELCRADRELSDIWLDYLASNEPFSVVYPTEFSLKSDTERYAEAKELFDLRSKVPVLEAKRKLTKEGLSKIFSTRLSAVERSAMFAEIDKMTVFETDPETLFKDLEAHLVSNATASELRGYPTEEADKAIQDHADKLSRIAVAQSEAAAITSKAPGGVSALSEKEKKNDS